MGRRKRIEDEELLAVAREVFVKNGVGAPTREIARRAGVSEGVIFQRFPTKEALFFAAMIPPSPDVEAILSVADEGGDALENFEEITLAALQYFREVMPQVLCLTSHPSFEPEKYFERYGDLPESHLFKGVQHYLEQEQHRGRAAETTDALSAAGILIATLHSLALFEIMGAHGGRIEEAAIRAMVGSLWNGLAPGRPSPGN